MKSRIIRKSKGEFIFDICINLIGLLVIIIVLVPLIFVVSASFSDPDLVLKGKVFLFPKGITLEPYKMVFQNKDIWQGYRNTIFYTITGTSISVILTVLAAYPLSRKEMAGRKYFMLIILFTMYFNGGLIPTYLLVRNLGLYDRVWALLIPSAISTFNLIVAKTFFESNIPDEMYESAKLDGCGNIRMLMSVVLPLSKAIIAILVLYYAVDQWNSYFNALIYLNNEKLYPLQIILRNILLLGQTEQLGTNAVGMGEKIKMAEGIKYSVIIISSVPILMVYPFVQKYFVKGVMIGSIKG
ncbi:carbohydrate ABC transporter permease [Anaerocolumna sp. MB42-C2]|uniref:carbohydrate ABC transporter permease n=1 Tax=Anaerocolumna sp. MB42-C2 TaxID=3070997 RepID=UPI0027E05869|nr:carbohydrate ABC transporter permease [Anaerocolumna sp. MB42-C2]WMJ89750.1 carbohydrate ABC transporter permease [Anaerocolumna sp. MB42-C2]